MVELKDGKGAEHWVVSMDAKKAVSWVELKDGKGVDHWVVTMAAKKAVSWVF